MGFAQIYKSVAFLLFIWPTIYQRLLLILNLELG